MSPESGCCSGCGVGVVIPTASLQRGGAPTRCRTISFSISFYVFSFTAYKDNFAKLGHRDAEQSATGHPHTQSATVASTHAIRYSGIHTRKAQKVEKLGTEQLGIFCKSLELARVAFQENAYYCNTSPSFI